MWRDSNSHVIKHSILNATRLLIPPHKHNVFYYSYLNKILYSFNVIHIWIALYIKVIQIMFKKHFTFVYILSQLILHCKSKQLIIRNFLWNVLHYIFIFLFIIDIILTKKFVYFVNKIWKHRKCYKFVAKPHRLANGMKAFCVA